MPKKETYQQAQERLLDEMEADGGWNVKRKNPQFKPLKIPYAVHRLTGTKVEFKPQAVYVDGYSTFIDRRDVRFDEFRAVVAKEVNDKERKKGY